LGRLLYFHEKSRTNHGTWSFKTKANGGKTPRPTKRILIIYGIRIAMALAAFGVIQNEEFQPVATFILGLILASFLSDWSWLRAISKAWPTTEKLIHWSRVQAVADGHPMPPAMPIHSSDIETNDHRPAQENSD